MEILPVTLVTNARKLRVASTTILTKWNEAIDDVFYYVFEDKLCDVYASLSVVKTSLFRTVVSITIVRLAS